MASKARGRHATLRGLSAEARDIFETRRERYSALAEEALVALYGKSHDVATVLERCLDVTAKAYAARPEELRQRDRRRLLAPDWYQQPEMLGYSAYADRFACDLPGVIDKLDYLGELGVTYLHLLPFTRPRKGDSDGGYAVESFTEIAPKLGGMADLERLAAACRARSMALATDFVLNHTADTHPWARRARAGDPSYRTFFYTIEDPDEIARIEAHLPEIFPVAAPGNFTRVEEMGCWVWTTFYGFQWDLNYANPEVFAEMLAVMLNFANRGIDVLRLDSAPFLWKRPGTDCRNLPEVHCLLRAFHAFSRMAAPALAVKAEAVVTPEHQTAYLGEGAHAGQECQLAYHNTLMVLAWSALAEARADRLTGTLRRMPFPPANSAWITYIRCHDDIGWSILEPIAEDASADEEIRRLAAFYAGESDGSFARGAHFQADPAHKVPGTAGTAAALAGLEAALETGDPQEIDIALRRILLLHGVIFAFGGIPLLYMGDELGLLNDKSYLDDPSRAYDARWLHRPAMDWRRAEKRLDADSVEGRLFRGIRRLAAARARCPALHADTPSRALHCSNSHVFLMRRAGARGGFLLLANFSDRPQAVPADDIRRARFEFPLHDILTGRRLAGVDALSLAPYELLWLQPE